MPSHPRLFLFSLLFAFCVTPLSRAQNPPSPNSDPTYQQLRNLTLGNEAVSVTGYNLRRDAATFHLKSGAVCFVPPVNGKVTGAVFIGDGSMSLDPPTADERRSLKLLTKSDEFNETFQRLVLRFTDSTYDELKKAGTPAQTTCDAGPLKDSQNVTRHRLHYNLEGRILEDVLRPESGGLFFAFVHGRHYDDKLLYVIDPDGAPDTAPEQIQLSTYDENKEGIWASFNMSREYRLSLEAAAFPVSRIHIQEQDLDTTIEGSARLSAKAKTTFVPVSKDTRVVPFDLFHTLRVQSVLGPDGQPLAFIQEDKNDDPDFFVVFPKPLAPGEKFSITTSYEGKEAVINTGNGNYYPVARDDWYPASQGASLGDYSSFDMIFRIPKGMKMAASGSLISEKDEGGHDVTEWKSDTTQPLAGFQFGRMKEQEAKLSSPDFLVATYANEAPPDGYSEMTGGTMGNLSTTSMMKEPLQEAQIAIQLYTSYFGPLPFKRLSITQQTACNYGQSWPDLVWLPICSFYDTTVRHQLGLDWADNGYWDVVAPHEVAHQWWGQLVGFGSYRDQWMSEGFADFSASLFLQAAYGKESAKKYAKFWNDEHKLIIQKNQFGFRPIDVGPVTMGYRLDNSKTGFSIGRSLIYPKGAYILQMVRMMMWNGQTGDKNFKEMMQDFVKTYAGRAATTEDFKAILEKHMTADMNAAGNGKMDWFFNEYVYGTALPSYSFTATFDKNPAGEVVFHYNLVQSGVDDSFIMPVPVYFELPDGRTIQLGRIRIKGNSTAEGKVALKGMKDPPKRALINYNNDVLAAN
ncbi:MAG TPA: M1 family aminopeptidase [Candidatus Limnocylindrales bacterium]|nr:M1 family aminopeptidase [Candidatus Limnocylindrales bacterium]